MSSGSGDKKKKPVEEKLEHDRSKKKVETCSGVRGPPKRLVKSVKAERQESVGRSSAEAAKKRSVSDKGGRSKRVVKSAKKKKMDSTCDRSADAGRKRSTDPRGKARKPMAKRSKLKSAAKCGAKKKGTIKPKKKKLKKKLGPFLGAAECKSEESEAREHWVAAGDGIRNLLGVVIDAADPRLSPERLDACLGLVDNFGDEFNTIVETYIRVCEPTYVFDADATDVAWYRQLWQRIRSDQTRAEAIPFLYLVLLEQRLYWRRVEIQMRRPEEDLDKVLQVVDDLIWRLDVPSLHLRFPLDLSKMQEYVIRHIVFRLHLGKAMITRYRDGHAFTAQQYFSAMGATKLVELFSEYNSDRGTEASGEVQQFAERQFANCIQAIRAFANKSEDSRDAAVTELLKAWSEGRTVNEFEYLVGLQQEPDLWKVLVKAITDGTLSSEATLQQLYSDANPIVDIRVVKAVAPFFKAKDDAKAKALVEAIQSKLEQSPTERAAFDKVLKIKTETFDKKPLHGVCIWKDTDAYDAAVPKPLASADDVLASAVKMRSDKRYPPRLTRGAAHSLSEAMDSREVLPLFESITESIGFVGAKIFFTSIKDDRRVQLKAHEYPGEEFPKTSYIPDRARCSVVFEDFESLYNGYLLFEKWKRTLAVKLRGFAVKVLRTKNAFVNLFAFGYGDLKFNEGIAKQRKDGSVAVAICETQLHVACIFEANRRAHVEYEIARLSQFFDKVVAASITPETIHSRKQLRACLSQTPLQNFLDFYGADKYSTVRSLLRICDLQLEDARALLKAVGGDWNPFEKGDSVALFVAAHAKNIEDWTSFLTECDGGDGWKVRANASGQIAVIKFMSYGFWKPRAIESLLPSKALAAKQLRDVEDMTPAHFAARRAAVVGPKPIHDFRRLFEGTCDYLMSVTSLTGSPLVEYLNAGGDDMEVARMLVPALGRRRKWNQRLLPLLDHTPKRLQMVSELIGERVFAELTRIKRDNVDALHLYAIRAVGSQPLDPEMVRILGQNSERTEKPLEVSSKLWEQIKKHE